MLLLLLMAKPLFRLMWGRVDYQKKERGPKPPTWVIRTAS